MLIEEVVVEVDIVLLNVEVVVNFDFIFVKVFYVK